MKRVLILKQEETRDQFDLKFKQVFDITFTNWLKTARCDADEECIEYEDGIIFAGMTAYDNGYKVYGPPSLLPCNRIIQLSLF